jgi:NAD(P)-dependent dehydrogenase (short-subunit alcohol dehydrogenase family)
MKVFVAGATGVIGRAIVPRLVRAATRLSACPTTRPKADYFAHSAHNLSWSTCSTEPCSPRCSKRRIRKPSVGL